MLVCDGRFDPNEYADFSTQWQMVDRPCADAVLLLDLQAREKHLEESKILAEKQLKAEKHRLKVLQASVFLPLQKKVLCIPGINPVTSV